jgi:hypothetical protein
MSETGYTSTGRIEKLEGARRRVRLQVGPAFVVGVHGVIRDHFGLTTEPEQPLPVDYLVGAAGA